MLVHQYKPTWSEKTWDDYERLTKKMDMLEKIRNARKPNKLRRRKLLYRAGVSYASGGEATKSSLADTVGLEGKEDLMDIDSSEDETSVNE
jgi:hypothetical protein